MKFLYSSSSSASSTATSDTYLYNPKNATSGCLAGMLRRLLRLNTLPTHPFDHTKEGGGNESKQFGEIGCTKSEEAKFEAPGNPGIVAKLMGLDSMPQIELGCGKAKLNSITRSRSMNHVDSRREGTMQGKHRRIKSTLSFREAPPFVELETEDFFILSFEGGGQDKELVLKPRRSDSSFGELKQRRVRKCKNNNRRRESGYGRNKENEVPNGVSSDGDVEDSTKILRQNTNLNHNSRAVEEVVKQSKPIHRKQTGERRGSRRKKKENCSPVEKVEIHDDSENSSPVSVLDFCEFTLKPKVPNPANLPLLFEILGTEEDSRFKNSISRRKLSGELERYKHSCPCSTNDSNNNDVDGKADNIEAKHFESWKINRKFQNYAVMWEEVSKLAETEIMKTNSIHRETNKLEEYEEIGTAFGQQILDQLISEFLKLLTFKRETLAL